MVQQPECAKAAGDGDYVIDADEMAEGCRFADVVVHKALFIVDIHNPDGAGQAEPTIQYCKPYDLPYRCFLPLGLEGLLVAGRCISGTHRVSLLISCHEYLHGRWERQLVLLLL